MIAVLTISEENGSAGASPSPNPAAIFQAGGGAVAPAVSFPCILCGVS
jgi:hypothetical protein